MSLAPFTALVDATHTVSNNASINRTIQLPSAAASADGDAPLRRTHHSNAHSGNDDKSKTHDDGGDEAERCGDIFLRG